MRQRVAIARALAMQPEVIFMDEPFSSVDAQTREKLQEELLYIWEKLNLTIIFITHNIEETIRLSTKIIVLGGQPAKIQKVINNQVAGKKTPLDTGFLELWNLLHESLNSAKK
jgi:NitT/TauT family transport system ATP-binding protein